MTKIKLSLCGILWSCCLFAVVSGSALSDSESEQLENSNSNPNPNLIEDSKCSFKCEDFKALENDNRELKNLKKSHAELQEQFKSLIKQFDEFKNEILSDCGISLLKPPLRGPPGKQGEKGDKGDSGVPGSNGFNGKGFPDPKSITSCSAAMTLLPFAPRRLSIYPHGNTNSKRVEVLCDFETDGGGWTLIQKRTSGPKEQFKQNWTEYQNGFGSLDGNFWMGLDNIRALTQNGDQELKIELEDFEGNKKYAKYSSFSVSDASDFYRLTLAGFSGGSTLQDDMVYVNGRRFSTMDKDNDNWNRNCAVARGGGGWWFNSCGLSNLNGLYFEKGETVPFEQGIYWYHWKGEYYSLAKSEMKIRKRKP